MRKGISNFTEEQATMFAKEMKRRREDANLSSKEFAELIGISQGYVLALERGIRKPSPITVDAITNTLGVELESMLNPNATPVKKSFDKEYGRKLFEGRMNKGFSRSLVAGALGIPVEVYVEFERGECSITDRHKELLDKLLDISEPTPVVEVAETPVVEEPPVAEEAVTFGTLVNEWSGIVPIDICNLIIDHVQDLQVDVEEQKKVWRYFTDMKIKEEERRLFG